MTKFQFSQIAAVQRSGGFGHGFWTSDIVLNFGFRHSNFLSMQLRTPITLITGPLGSGKTTLLRHILATRPTKIAIVMNEFGEIAIDTKVIEGKNVRIAELGGGCG